MVATSAAELCWLLAQAPTVKQMPPTTKVMVLMALLGIVLLGLLIVVLILLGGHWVRRIGSHRRGPSVPPDFSWKKELLDEESPIPESHHPSGETFVDNDTKDTRNS